MCGLSGGRGEGRVVCRDGVGLQAVQIGDGAFGVSGGLEDGALVVLQDLQLSAATHNAKEGGQIA